MVKQLGIKIIQSGFINFKTNLIGINPPVIVFNKTLNGVLMGCDIISRFKCGLRLRFLDHIIRQGG